MNITRRGFIKTLAIMAAAPAIVRAESIMRVVPVSPVISSTRELEYLVQLAIKLDAARVPKENRVAYINGANLRMLRDKYETPAQIVAIGEPIIGGRILIPGFNTV